MRKYENNNLIGYQPCYIDMDEQNGKLLIIEWYKFVYSIKVMTCTIRGNIIRLVIGMKMILETQFKLE